ncbi:palmitoyltransferase ZDHHC2/15/20 [Entomortierella parvispora]|uniref:Palmitoyltransferase n=1 Tax=Entomortierella parvispora TaxID=205924 RepID=A0A9P3LYM0_9FUNG|nr:palmitoyltransferase ZDHHC2/15/20 [Entomortierella parvispora]
MKIRRIRESCLKALSWLPVGICLALVGWSYLVFVFSVCRYLLTHDHVFQGVFYLGMMTTIVVLLLWSYSLATFLSPGYPSEILKKYTGYNSADHGDITMLDQEDSARVGLLEPEQFYLSPSPSANNSPLMKNGRKVVHRDRHHHPLGPSPGSPDEADLGDPHQQRPHSPFVPSGGQNQQSDSWSQQTYPVSQEPSTPSPFSNGKKASFFSPEPSFEPAGQGRDQRAAHTTVRIPDDSLDGQTIVENDGVLSESRHRFRGGDHDYEDDQEDNRPLGLSGQRFTVKRDGKMRYCQKCKFEKPDRTHHCSSCKRCVLKMDHHCPWLNNCVGHNNYKAFYLFVFWTAVYCVVMVACTIPVVAEVINGPYNENVFDAQWIFMIFMGIIFGLCLVPFAIHHTLLIKSNKTTIESFEKHKYRMGSSGEVMQSRVLNVFDLGKKKNFIQVLGPVWYLWLIPVRNSVGNGWSFPANDYGKSMLQGDGDDGSSHFHRRGVAPSIASSFRPLDHSNSSEEHHRLQTQHPYPRQHQQHQQQQQQYHQYPQHDLSAYGDRFDLTTDSDPQSQGHYRQDLTYDLENHVRPDSDADSDNDGPFGRSNRFPAPTPRRFRQYRPGFAPSNAPFGQKGRQVQDSDDEDDDEDERDVEQEEYVYDSDEMGHTIA